MLVCDLRLSGDEPTELVVPDGWTTALVVLRGELDLNGSEPIRAAEVGLFDRAGAGIQVDAARDARAPAERCPIGEPIVGMGPRHEHPREISRR
jgi:redox-sensitive bicupin YhaK (pirin superfamily)